MLNFCLKKKKPKKKKKENCNSYAFKYAMAIDAPFLNIKIYIINILIALFCRARKFLNEDLPFGISMLLLVVVVRVSVCIRFTE